MKKILVIGAGLSSSALIDYLAENAPQFDWQLTVVDADPANAEALTAEYPHVISGRLDVTNEYNRSILIRKQTLVISLVPAALHAIVAEDCLKYDVHLITPSYVAPEIKAIHEPVRLSNLIFLNELGLDPGIDHMSLMEMIGKIRAEGGRIKSFYSYTGALIAPESDTNPWHYKITWNPRNVVMAGRGVAQIIENGHLKLIPYNRLFDNIKTITIPGFGDFEAYLNRNSAKYAGLYDLEEAETLVRGTLRYPGFCRAWSHLVRLGLTDEEQIIADAKDMSYRQFLATFLLDDGKDLRESLADYMGIDSDGQMMQQIEYLGLLSDDEKIGRDNVTPSQILQQVLRDKWRMQQDDKDLIAMTHIVEYTVGEKAYRLQSYMINKGNNINDTALARTVGLPIGIAAKLLLQDRIKSRGVLIPNIREIYEPVLTELQQHGIEFTEVKQELN